MLRTIFSTHAMKIVATTGEMQDPVWALKTCQYKVLLNKNKVKLNHYFKQNMMVRLNKLRSFDNRSKIRTLISLIGTDVIN